MRLKKRKATISSFSTAIFNAVFDYPREWALEHMEDFESFHRPTCSGSGSSDSDNGCDRFGLGLLFPCGLPSYELQRAVSGWRFLLQFQRLSFDCSGIRC